MLFYKQHPKISAPVIFLHGFLGSSKDAKGLLSSKILSWHLIDLPGHGKNSAVSLDDLKNYLDQLQSPFHLVGYSMGGRLAQHLSHHKNCLSLSLLSSHTLFTPQELALRQTFEKELKEKLERMEIKEFVDDFYSSSLFTPLRRRKSRFENYLLARYKLDKQALLSGLEELTIDKLLSPLPQKPILGLYGSLDLKYQKLYTLLPSSVAVVSVKDAGHALLIENPKECLALLEQFIGAWDHELATMRTLSGY